MTEGKPPAPFHERALRGVLLALEQTKRAADALERIASVLERVNPEPLPEVDLDDRERGDPVVRFDPKSWKCSSFKQRPYSTCPPEFLDELAKTLEYFASSNTDAKKKRYDLLDAARARGWAARLRDGWKKPASTTQVSAPPSAIAPAPRPAPYVTPPISVPPPTVERGEPIPDPAIALEDPFGDTSILEDLPSLDDASDDPDAGP